MGSQERADSVIWVGFCVLNERTNNWRVPPRLREYTSDLPSGEKIGSTSFSGSKARGTSDIFPAMRSGLSCTQRNAAAHPSSVSSTAAAVIFQEWRLLVPARGRAEGSSRID